MGQNQSAPGGPGGADKKKDGQDKKKKWEPPAPPPRVGKKQKKRDAASSLGAKLPTVTPSARCRLRLLKLERVKDYLLMEHEFVQNQERLKPQDERNEEDRSKVDDLRGSPLSVGSLEEIIDENHAIVSSAVGPEYYVSILSFVDKSQLEPGCSVLLHNKVCPKLVRELFRVADEMAPSIVFIDEIDAIGTKRYDSHSGGEREIQRTMLELLNQMDGFDAMSEVKVIMATNRIETLDPALIRPGRIDRKIEFPLPDAKTKRRIFGIHTSDMCPPPQADFRKAKEKVLYKKKEGVPEGLYM
ncbi:26S proteasome regulatory subunit-like [Raphidocelis subcapitata]|uniref:26S proteasome regulatory subunit-like n=1 Tax=Raphidocelis subcapitata TaxID=307507 RepID=A0A2V0PQY4_9CHLO|nr:26S proteasome regulatory subunit-like [Raphidocelis subcapitata]|eukprot:GBG00624.1 26S proteasome regulatory subunit-like [Raphidocelis subcapitata]